MRVKNAGFRHVDRTELSYFTLWTLASIPGLIIALVMMVSAQRNIQLVEYITN